MFETNKIIGSNFECNLQSGESEFLHFNHRNGTQIILKNFECNGFNEDGALLQKLKVHSTLDNYSASAELFQTIPFGTEFEIRRNFDFCDSFARVIVDVNPGIGAVEKLKLEDFEICGEFNSLQVFFIENNQVKMEKFNLSDEHVVINQENRFVLAFNLTCSDGVKFECGAGNDLWRHLAAENFENCSNWFMIEGNNRKITFSRQILAFENSEDAPRKRSWRLKYYFAWDDFDKSSSDIDYCKIALSDLIGDDCSHVNSLASTPCIAAPLCRRSLRNMLRKTDKNIELAANLALCTDASHLERSGDNQLLHWGIDDFFELSLWATKLLSKNNLYFRFAIQDDLLAELVGLQVLNKNLENAIETE